jgi:secretion/DNA translocation related TadE-like protein
MGVPPCTGGTPRLGGSSVLGGRSEAGVATVAAAATVGLVLLVAAALVQVGLVIAAKHRVQAAADLAALAGSAASLHGDDGCTSARVVAARNGADVASCRADLAVVTVTAESSTASVVWGTRFRTHAVARAAPDFYVPDPAGTGEGVGASRKSRSSSRMAPALSSGSFPLPHFGD